MSKTEEKQAESMSVEAYQEAIQEVNERFGYRMKAQVIPVEGSRFFKAEIVVIKNG